MKCGWTDSIIRRGGLLAIVSALVLTLACSRPALAQTAQAYRQQADTFVRSKSWDEAITAYRKALELDPNDALTHYDLALAFNYKGDTKQAVEEFQSAIQLKPGWGQAHYSLGVALYTLHDQAGARKELRKALACEPANAAAHVFLAHVYSEQNDFPAAERELSRAVTLKPAAETHFELGEVEGQLGKLDAAAARRAIPSSALGVSVMPGISGEHRIPTRNPASRSLSTVRNRKSGRGARGSRIRASFASGVVIVRCSVSRFLLAISTSRSMSRSISVDFVTIPDRSPCRSANTSSKLRVTCASRSIGWYGSVAVPSAICSPGRTCLSSWRNSHAACCLM